MAKELPYFKFYCSEWNDGDITLEEFRTQGVFINICSLYWSRGCNLTLEKLKRRFKDNVRDIEILLSENLIKNLNDGSIKIRFLDEQWTGKDARSTTSRINGSKGGRPKKPKKPNQNLTKPNIEEIREEEKREEDKENSSEPTLVAPSNNLDFNYTNGLFEKDIPEVWLQVWIDAYPAVDILLEINKAKAWLFANPKKRKKDHKAFLNNWLARCQKNGGNIASNKVKNPHSPF